MITWCRNVAALLIAAVFCLPVFAGGSGLNVAVVVNQNSTNSVQLGNYYCERRGVPPQNLIRINWTGGNLTWTRAEFETILRSSLTNALNARILTNQIEFVVLCMDIPYRITETTGSSATSGINSTTAALFYGFKLDGCISCPAGFPSCNLPLDSTSAYAGSESIFRQMPPISASSNSWLTFLLTATNLSKAKALVDLGTVSDASFPTQNVFLTRSYDVVRNIRFVQADNVILNTRLRGNYGVVLINTYSDFGLGPMLGFQDGVQQFNMYGSYVPGAMADNLTSFSGYLFESVGHTTAMDFINNGATASYGTIVEPCAYPDKFPVAQNYFFQARGFSIGECYYQSVTNPYQGIMVGEPLAAPFALPASGSWVGLQDGAILAGTTNLSVQFNSASIALPVGQVDLFLDGQWLNTVSNIPPRQNNILYVTVNGSQTNYIIPASATIKSVASNLVLRLNGNSYSNVTKVAAIAHGDRIELQNLNITKTGAGLPIVVSNHLGTATALNTFISATGSNFLDTTALGLRNFVITNTVANGTWLQIVVTKTNGAATTIAVTNSSGNTDTSLLIQSLMTAINTNPSLMAADGVMAENLINYIPFGLTGGEFNLLARSPGWAESQIQAVITDSGPLTIIPSGTQRLDENFNDLRQRAHIYITAGLTNWNLTVPFNTVTNADGYHKLTAVAYEGSHVRTQERISRNIRIANNGWTAALTCLMGGANTALEATLQFLVTQTTNNITKIELFSTGGSLGVSNNVSSATFSVAASYLGIGLHPFYAVVTKSDGKQYRTYTKWIRIVGEETPFSISVLDPTPTLIWPATAGRGYQILSATNITNGFTLRSGVTPTNSSALWSETNNSSQQRYYRVKTP